MIGLKMILKNNHVFDGAFLLNRPPDNFNRGHWLTVDPGNNTAVCHWYDGRMGFIFTYKDCIKSMQSVHLTCFSKIIIENVELWGGSSISYASAASGDLFKLAMVVGALIYQFTKDSHCVYIVSPKKWKGQLNQEQLQFILKNKFNVIAKNEHEASAIGIGLWAAGKF